MKFFHVYNEDCFKGLVKNNLINKEWNTSFETVVDKNGELSFRGFYGEYEVIVDDNTYTVNFDSDGLEISL